MDKVLVIIVTYNAHNWIHQCLNSVDMERYDAFVVDNASTDDTRHILKAEYPKAIVRAMDKNLGFGQANNVGLRYALDNGYDYVFLLNQDAWLLPDTIEKLIIAQKQHPEYWVLSPLQMNTAQGGVEKQFGVYCKKNKIQLNLDVPQQVDFVNAALWLIPIECIKIVGGFDPIFPHDGEDVDYANRVRYWKGCIGVVATVQGFHERDICVNDVIDSKFVDKQIIAGMVYLKDINNVGLIALLRYSEFLIRKIIKYLMIKRMDYIRHYDSIIKHLFAKRQTIKQHRLISKTKQSYLV